MHIRNLGSDLLSKKLHRLYLEGSGLAWSLSMFINALNVYMPKFMYKKSKNKS